MSRFCPLASGSKGNCIYLETPHTKVLIDAGLSGRKTKQLLNSIGASLNEIEAILITHDHGDHIAGLKSLAFKYQIPIFANSETAKGIVETFRDCPKFKIFATGEKFSYKDLEVTPFSVSHDTMDPVAFRIEMEKTTIGFCTDLGFAPTHVEYHLQNCDYLYLEANHQPSMVYACNRTNHYKQRVLSRTGHLSNVECGYLLKKIWHPNLKHVHLAHLSSECNTPETAISVVSQILTEEKLHIPLSIAHQDYVSKIIEFDTAGKDEFLVQLQQSAQ